MQLSVRVVVSLRYIWFTLTRLNITGLGCSSVLEWSCQVYLVYSNKIKYHSTGLGCSSVLEWSCQVYLVYSNKIKYHRTGMQLSVRVVVSLRYIWFTLTRLNITGLGCSSVLEWSCQVYLVYSNKIKYHRTGMQLSVRVVVSGISGLL